MRAATIGRILVAISLCAGCATQRVGLDAGSATLHGNLKYSAAEKVLCHWNSLDQFATWSATIPEPGEYDVSITYACPNGDSGSEVRITIGDKVLTKTVNGSSGWGKYMTETIGSVSLTEGTYEVKVAPTKKPSRWVMDMKEIVLSRK